jgi:hypothetical protein
MKNDIKLHPSGSVSGNSNLVNIEKGTKVSGNIVDKYLMLIHNTEKCDIACILHIPIRFIKFDK